MARRRRDSARKTVIKMRRLALKVLIRYYIKIHKHRKSPIKGWHLLKRV